MKRFEQADSLTIPTVARLCRVSSTTVTGWISDGLLKFSKLPSGHTSINVKELVNFMQRYKMSVSSELPDVLEATPRLSMSETLKAISMRGQIALLGRCAVRFFPTLLEDKSLPQETIDEIGEIQKEVFEFLLTADSSRYLDYSARMHFPIQGVKGFKDFKGDDVTHKILKVFHHLNQALVAGIMFDLSMGADDTKFLGNAHEHVLAGVALYHEVISDFPKKERISYEKLFNVDLAIATALYSLTKNSHSKTFVDARVFGPVFGGEETDSSHTEEHSGNHKLTIEITVEDDTEVSRIMPHIEKLLIHANQLHMLHTSGVALQISDVEVEQDIKALV